MSSDPRIAPGLPRSPAADIHSSHDEGELPEDPGNLYHIGDRRDTIFVPRPSPAVAAAYTNSTQPSPAAAAAHTTSQPNPYRYHPANNADLNATDVKAIKDSGAGYIPTANFTDINVRDRCPRRRARCPASLRWDGG